MLSIPHQGVATRTRRGATIPKDRCTEQQLSYSRLSQHHVVSAHQLPRPALSDAAADLSAGVRVPPAVGACLLLLRGLQDSRATYKKEHHIRMYMLLAASN